MAFEVTQIPEYVAVIRRNGTNAQGQPIGGRQWAGEWVEEPRLIPTIYTKKAYGLGDASFQMVGNQFYSQGQLIQGNEILSGSYIGIATRKTDGSLNEPLWVGFIVSMPSLKVKQQDFTEGTIAAKRLGAMLDQLPLIDWQVLRNNGTSDYFAFMDNPPPANYGKMGGVIIGNKVENPLSASLAFIFQNDPAKCGELNDNYWSRIDLLNHITFYTWPKGIGLPVLNFTTAAAARLITVVKETYNLENTTIKSALDILINRQRGLVWDLEVDGDLWAINIRLTYDAAESVNVDLSSINRDTVLALNVKDNEGSQIDEIVVEGHPILWFGTIENGTASQTGTPKYFEPGWTTTQEADFITALTANKVDPIDPKYADVFRSWRFKDPDGGDTIKTQHAVTGQGPAVFFCQTLTYNKTSHLLSVNAENDSLPYLATAKISRTTPWSVGVSATSDTRDVTQTTNTSYLPPTMWNRQDLTNSGTVDVSNKSVSGDVLFAEDRGLSMRLRLGTNGHAYSRTETDGIADLIELAEYHWEANAWSVAIESNQNVRISQLRDPSLVNDPTRKVMKIKGDWHCWAVHSGTIVAIDSSNDPVRTSTFGPENKQTLENGKTFILRSDFRAAEFAMDEAATWAFRNTKSGSITLSDVAFTESWATTIGQSIDDIIDADTNDPRVDLLGLPISKTYEINGSIEAISVNLDINNPTITISFGVADTPGITGGSPTTIVTNASTAQNLSQVNRDIQRIDQQMQQFPVHTAHGGGGGSTAVPRQIEIIDGQTIAPADILGIKFADPAATLVISDPTTGGTRATGLGRGRYLDTGEFIMVVHDVDAPYGAQQAHIVGDFGVSVQTVSVTVGEDTTVYHYIARF